MKKSIKYAGIAAATLLAVAPVAAPVVSTTAQAAVTSVATDQSKQNDAVTAFGNQFADVTAKSIVDGGKSITLGSQKLSDFATNNADLIKTAATLENMNDLIGSGATVTVSAKYGSTSINQADLTKILADETYPAVEFTITLNYNNLNDQAVSKTYTVKATRTTTDNNANELKTVNAKFTTPVSVALDSTTTSTQLTATTDIHLTDQNGDGVVAGTVKADTNYYNTYADAMNGNTTSATNTVVNNKFTKAGTYYQAISFTAGNGSSLATFISNYTQDPSSYTVYVNGAKASAGYDFKASTDNTTLTFVRAINVSNTTDNWTTTDTTGVVTTKSASKYYTLKNDDNATIANRALGANTPWRTDKVRTNQDGVKQYRVATGEWIDADNVVYSNGDNNNSNNGSGLTDIKTVSGVATLTKAKGYFMALFNDEGKAYDNKYLGSPSAWRVDRTAKGADGNTYYRVATSEWLQAGEGVSFK
ncbi:hypothetical protein [Companilactobacillus bobalius]|uniref:Surface layer protein A domain-containing protein n=2 Tax=Companilactobacillus bobalius TaxID=2801451 RepID=A0A202F9A0_9LACO|nr:hypothetical protein [Companilactobacillus bobalius]GEO59242.1 hypothetical protein LBO01_23710 [Companilactobacillus paralimentarius]KAE9559596.1 hypothetical protein ATN92_12020 [Companilactobacillus bobalius]KAE9561487.1 hypothetical protein ATN92_05240 [Companilactobacillus bobalius]KRK82383.1 hypothetical protein FC78_GL002389 [Companilactobacillus bobalius DSM 19674]OVE97051.1 hypothetical protein LKACC16343_02061 [Companilactobacillus bobalius]